MTQYVVLCTCPPVCQEDRRTGLLGVPHSRIQVELGFILEAGTCQILNFAARQSQSVQGTDIWGGGHHTEKVYTGRGDTTHIF